jgi:HlyD family secretion protein
VKTRLFIVLFLLLLLGVGLLVYMGQRSRQSAAIHYSGTIEADEANLSFQVSGRVESVLADEGDKVEIGQILAHLDQSEFLARRNQVREELGRSVEGVERIKAVLDLQRMTLPDEVARAEAAVKSLQATLEELETGYRHQEVERGRLAMEQARLAMEKAGKDRDRFNELKKRGAISEKERESAELAYETAEREYARTRKAYDLLKEGPRIESIRTARARLSEGQAALRQARNNLGQTEITERELDGAQAQVRAASAALELAEIQLGHTLLKAPFPGTVTSRNLEPGEVVSPGREVISLADLSRIDLKIYVGETEIGKVHPGQAAEVRIDTFPGKTYEGRVTFVSPQAEFTPKIIQTHKERVKLVYLVKISIPNPQLELKPGMPADAWLK